MNFLQAIQIFVIACIILAWPLTYYFMLGAIEAPSDETGHALGVFFLSILWAGFSGLSLIIIAIATSFKKKLCQSYLISLSFLPLSWFILWMGFLLFERKVTITSAIIELFLVCLVIAIMGAFILSKLRRNDEDVI